MASGNQPIAAGARHERIEQDHLQIAAMDRELRTLVTGGTAERLLIDQLAEAIEESCVGRLDRDPRQCRLQPKSGKLLGCVREQIDADPNGLDFCGRFKDPARDSGSMQGQSQRQSANAGADDNNVVHLSSRPSTTNRRDETRLVSLLSIKLPMRTFP